MLLKGAGRFGRLLEGLNRGVPNPCVNSVQTKQAFTVCPQVLLAAEVVYSIRCVLYDPEDLRYTVNV